MGNLLTPGEVAEIFGVSYLTLKRWSDRGLIEYVMLPSGFRRYRVEEVERILNEGIRPVKATA